ncbi:nephrin isoform X1 [Oncorhynchus kisutch]|uniref:NPHS1 adhesion molecule, nephrin n=1 Tax=Oncorhynchus kisutch TaxID=8019 RepID=A0A8C7FMH4_ONCKI|nr:nephrin isoform X1 [Oncorhynchus kisutch]
MGLSSTTCFPSPLLLLLTLQWGLVEVGAQQAFRTQPKNMTVRAGTTVMLRCEVLRPSGVVQWVKDGLLLGPQQSLPGFPRYSLLGDPKRGQYYLQIEKTELEDDGPYECQVGQSESSRAIISHTAWINVQIPPSKPYFELETTEPWVAGKSYTVTCIAPDAKPEAVITLFKDGVELTGVESFPMSGSEDKLQNTHATKEFMFLSSSDNGRELVCRAKNPALPRALETSLVMNVYFPPQNPVIQGLDREGLVKRGTTLKLFCVSQGGNPLATLHWTKNGEVISTSWEVDTESRRAISHLTLQVKPQDNQAELCCESVNQVTPVPLSNSRKITVLFEPEKVMVLGLFEAREGEEVTLCCYTSSSNPPVHIRWWLGFRELNTTVVNVEEGDHGGKTTMSNLTHVVSREENGLPLTCETFNKGTRFSKSQSNNLIVFYPPQKVWIEAPPPGLPLRSGTIIRLICFSIGGSPKGTLNWYKDDKALSDYPKQVPSDKGVSKELAVRLQPSDNMATYRCNATNKAKMVLNASVKLMVQFPAVSVTIIAKQKELRRGQNLSLDCLSGSSNPQANISWSLGSTRLKGVDLPPKNTTFGGISVRSTLSLPLSSQHHGQRITCQAYSSLLSEGVNTFYKLNVLYPPEFIPDHPQKIQVVEDDTAILPLLVSANPDDVSCSWLYRKEELHKEMDPRYHFTESTAFEIWNVTRRDTGVYTVNCTNEVGSDNTTITLDVQYAPSVKMEKDPVYVDVGETADLFCVADANPIINTEMFSWKWLGEGEMEEMGEQSQDEATGQLTIQGATRAQAGRYQCTADNNIEPPASVSVQLVVRFMPELQKGAQWNKVASRGDGTRTAEVVCQGEGIPRLHFSWAKNGVPIDFIHPRYQEKTVREGSLHTSTVTVVNVSAALDYAVFTCTAHNTLGEDTLNIQLLSTNQPDPPSEFRLVSFTHASATLEWIPGFDGGLEQRFRVRYRWADSVSFLYVDVFPPRANIFIVTGLSPATTYNFSVNALNSMGESGYADNNSVLTITTEEWEGAVQAEDPLGEETRGLSLYQTVIMAVVGGAPLLALNWLGCFLCLRWKKRRGQTESKGSVSDGKKSEGDGSTVSTASGSTRYEVRELVNPAAQRTLLIDSGSEPDSSVYESYAGEGSHYYYPTSDYHPSLYPHPEGAQGQDGRCYPLEPIGHEYEEVRDWGMYQDVLGLSLPLPPSQFDPWLPEQRREWRPPPPSYPQGSGRGMTAPQQPIRRKDPVVERRPEKNDYDLPFELRGQLV